MDENDGMPPICIMVDPECESAPYYLRIAKGRDVEQIELGNSRGPVRTLPSAFAAAIAAGWRPTHYRMPRSAPEPIPSGIAGSRGDGA
jgi:hypothetical protein